MIASEAIERAGNIFVPEVISIQEMHKRLQFVVAFNLARIKAEKMS